MKLLPHASQTTIKPTWFSVVALVGILFVPAFFFMDVTTCSAYRKPGPTPLLCDLEDLTWPLLYLSVLAVPIITVSALIKPKYRPFARSYILILSTAILVLLMLPSVPFLFYLFR